MKPFIVLIAAFVISLVIIKLFNGVYDAKLAARIAMSVMLVFTSIAHFAFTKGMTMMIPEFIPFKKELVYLTGVFEIAAAITFLVPSLVVLTGWILVVFFLLMLPANINAAMRKVDYRAGTNNGSGLGYLWFRVPLQLLFIGWVVWASLV